MGRRTLYIVADTDFTKYSIAIQAYQLVLSTTLLHPNSPLSYGL